METINFISAGLMGDFVQSLFAVKNICMQRGCKANLYITEGYGGDIFTYGVETAFNDIKELVYHQPYINSFQILSKEVDDSFINLNSWREEAATEFVEKGEYSICWTERLGRRFNFAPVDYKWLEPLKPDHRARNKILIHRSKHRHGGMPWQTILNAFPKDIMFVTTNTNEYLEFKKLFNGYYPLLLVKDITEMANAIASCKYFIGNQSAPFSIANALDVPRLGDLEAGVYKFYKDETKYSKNISWHLSAEEKYFAENSLIQL